MYYTTCKHCQAINYQGARQCHNCKHQLFERLPDSNNTTTTSSAPVVKWKTR